jgi:hypothetical protein
MSQVTGILCQIITGNVNNAGTDGWVYLGLGGREFRLDSTADDYERGSLREYILGRSPLEPNLPPFGIRVQNPQFNDPRVGFPLDTVNLPRNPVYIRFEPHGGSPNWNLGFVAVLVYVGEGQFVLAYVPTRDFDNLWLGDPMGKILYLTDTVSGGVQRILDEQAILDMGRRLAAQGGNDPLVT